MSSLEPSPHVRWVFTPRRDECAPLLVCDCGNDYLFPRLVGISEIAEMLGRSKQRASQLQTNPDFPRPVLRISAGAFYLRDEIEEYAETRITRPGPRPGSKRVTS